MIDRLFGVPNADKRELGSPSATKTAREILKTLPYPDTLPLPSTPPDILPRVLFIDDEQINITNTVAIFLGTKLRDHARLDTFLYRSEQEDSLVSLLRQSLDDRDPFTAVYVDLNLRGAGRDAGLGLIERLREQEKRLRYIAFVAVTSYPNYEIERKARDRGAIRFMLKTETHGAQSVLGGFVHRMITEANETLEQSKDQLWADASALLANELRDKSWREACKVVIDFIHQNFIADALFARQDDGSGVLRLVHAMDLFSLGPAELRIADVPFIRDFLTTKDEPASSIIANLTAVQIGSTLTKSSAERLLHMRALLVRISLGRTSHGLLTIYRHAKAHCFRPQDEHGLTQIALRLATAILAEEEANKLRKRQSEIIEILRAFDAASVAKEVYDRLQDALFHQIGNSAPGGNYDLKSSVRRIEPGTNVASRALAAQGFQIKRAAPNICLEDINTSSIARTVWKGKPEYAPDVTASGLQGFHVLVADGIRSTLTIPLMASGLCLGAATLESRQPAAFNEGDRDFAQLLCVTAAEALLRIRTRSFLDGMVALVQGLTVSGTSSGDDYIQQVVKLLFAFTGCSEILFLIPPSDGSDPWHIDRIFLPDGTVLDEIHTRVARKYTTENWNESYDRRVLTGSKKASWSDDPDTLKVHDEKFARRQRGEKTRAQAVIIVRKDDHRPPEALISLLFQHRHAVSDRQMPLLDSLGSVLASLLAQGQQFQHLFGLAAIHEQEAKLGQVFGQFRHSLLGRLAKLRGLLDDGAHAALSMEELLREALPVLTDLESDISRNRGLVKIPELVTLDLGIVWSCTATQLAGIVRRYGGKIMPAQLAGTMVHSDPEILETIMFNLLDNALRHGGANVQISAHAVKQNGKVEVLVSDTGPGIGAEMQRNLFAPGKTTTADSTGMGLYLSAGRATDLGGSLTLVSTGPKGTTFRLTLPGCGA